MNLGTKWLWVAGWLAVFSTPAKDIQFGGYTWAVRGGRGGPGPNAWDENNVWLDASTNLHLKISHATGDGPAPKSRCGSAWVLAATSFKPAAGSTGLDDNVVLGLFNYPTADVGPDGTHEIDIEFARWGDAEKPDGQLHRLAGRKGVEAGFQSFPFTLAGDQRRTGLSGAATRLQFRSLQGHRDDDGRRLYGRWIYSPQDAPERISQQPMPVHINLWLFKGMPPKDGQEVEVILHKFEFIPE